jgi:Fe-S-cluster containining protein
MGTDCNICSNKCYGMPGHHGSCCTLEDRDFIIGPHPDAEEFIERLSDKLGREIDYREVFVDYEEGKSLFPNKSTWQNPGSYPAFRVDFYNPRLPCIFYNTKVRACSMYDIRPTTCQEYECEYLTNSLTS